MLVQKLTGNIEEIYQCILKAFTSFDYPKLFFNKAVLPIVDCSLERIAELLLKCVFLIRLFLQEKESLKLDLRKVDKQENMPC